MLRSFLIFSYILSFFGISWSYKTWKFSWSIKCFRRWAYNFCQMDVNWCINLILYEEEKWTNNILIITLVLLSLASGSRGPILSFLLTILVFFVLNFRRSFINVFLVSIFLSILFTLITLNKMDDVGKADRLLTKNKTSKNVRLEFASRSLELVYKYPFGVGIGNWQEYCNQSQPHHLLRHEYPHNLLLEIFVELGILGGLIFLYLLIKSYIFYI